MRNLKKAYFNWLYNNVDNPRKAVSYTKLCEVLFNRTFTWFVPNDDNRAQDGRDLREYFLKERRGAESPEIIDQFLEERANVMEVLVGVAKRMDFIMYDQNREELTPKWFSILLLNLGLDEYTDDREFDPGLCAEINRKLDVFLRRTYDRQGNGSLFPIKGNTPRDMRRTEIWYQMQAYIQENFED